ncbi:c-type cytochrome [Robiginitalea sp. M366]|uniref:DUF7133 domain-containing protein n=1 Tax=Robiginitalea aestuariiviva TaxID=3036903 RepID=UPI00240D2B21|nr:c-type cytochrome [Robiginitalea aestuariiviva]MDG1571134.1 c-type cytochrome [Robiginitalea aestuariiviva]
MNRSLYSAGALTGILCLLFTAACREPGPHPVDQVIGSFSDTLPQVAPPEGTDPEDPNWKGADLEPKAPVIPLYASEAAKHFLLPEGYQISPVLTEPQIQQPGAIAFDGNGRMYVLELRTYMLNADSEGTLDPVSRISRWEDRDNDGIYETGGVFVDSLVFPRFVLPYGKDCILAMETNQDNVYRYTDTDGDGKADRKELFATQFGRFGNVEHQQAFLYYGMDNWLYSTVNAFRVRETPGGLVRQPTGYNRAQWGITHDDDGKLWFLGGASGLPSYFQFPIHYGNIEVEASFAEGFEVPWGAPIGVADVQGGMDAVRQPDGSLNRVTGAAGNDIFRGDRLPPELYGKLFYGEPVARIIRQANPEVREGLTTLHNPYQESRSEFLRSTDPLFRPVDLTTAPDGTLYVTDMYHGIIQEGEWAQPGSYLRAKIEQYQLDKVIRLGRVWRISHNSLPRNREQPRMLDQAPAELLQYLSHPNGWWRDKAQQLIVLSGDRSLGAALEQLTRPGHPVEARIHALWCLEGLGTLSESQIRALAADPNPRIRIQALRAGESLAGQGSTSLHPLYLSALEDPQVDVALQAMLSMAWLELPEWREHIAAVLEANPSRGIQTVGAQLLAREPEKKENAPFPLSEPQKESLARGAAIFNELCVQCHGPGGHGKPLGNGSYMAPVLAGSARVQGHPAYVVKTVMHGLQGPLDGNTFAGGVMVGNAEQPDRWIADVSSYIRVLLGNGASMVSEAEVSRIREETAAQSQPYTYKRLREEVPLALEFGPDWKVTASHSGPVIIGGSENPESGFNFEGWTTGSAQQNGMWYQVRLPRSARLYELAFDAPANGLPWQADKKPPAYPRGLRVLTSADGTAWEEVVRAHPEQQQVHLPLDGQPARYLRLELEDIPSDLGDIPWSIRNLKIYGQYENHMPQNPSNTQSP